MSARNGWLAPVLVGGGMAATLDIAYACISLAARADKTAQWTFQSVASGWLGRAAFESGWPGAMLGLGSHYFILFVAAFIYLQASRRFTFLATQAVACGAVFGVCVYLFMNFVVLPLSAFPAKLSYPLMRLVEGFATHALLVGIPVALAVRRFGSPATGAQLPG